MISAYDEIYLENARVSLASMIHFAVNVLNYNLRDFWNTFLASDISRRFERGEFSIISGKSGIELAYDILKVYDERDVNMEIYDDKSPEYWLGWALAYYQWNKNLSFEQIDKVVPIENIVKMYFPYHEMDIQHFVDRINELLFKDNKETKLKTRRKLLGLTQKDLANATGVPLRTIQQYEQGQKNINCARSIYIVALAKALYCSPEELLESVD